MKLILTGPTMRRRCVTAAAPARLLRYAASTKKG
jgi:hypothetical protein